MNIKNFFCVLLFCTSFSACKSPRKDEAIQVKNSTCEATALLGHPFGTILNLSVQIVDGDSLDSKGLSGIYVLKIDSINNVPASDSLFMEFQDQTGRFPVNDSELSKLINGNDKGLHSDEAYSEVKKNYVGKHFKIVAFETGSFTGTPDGYFDYQPIIQTPSFYFKNSLIIIGIQGEQKRKRGL